MSKYRIERINQFKQAYDSGSLTGEQKEAFEELVKMGEIDHTLATGQYDTSFKGMANTIKKEGDEIDRKISSINNLIFNLEKSNKTGLGKTLNVTRAVLNAPLDFFGWGDETNLEKLKSKRDQLISQRDRGVTQLGQIKESVIEGTRDLAGDTVRAGLAVIPGGAKVTAKIASKFQKPLAKFLSEMGTQATIQSSVAAGGRLAEELVRGENISNSINKAKNDGIGATAITLALMPSIKGSEHLNKIIAPYVKGGAKAAMEWLQSIKPARSEWALKRELEGKSLFNNKFN